MPKKTTTQPKYFNLLFIGDVIGEVGRETVKKVLPKLKEKYQIDFVIANGEHLSERVGVEKAKIIEMRSAGVDFFTTGNHVWREKEFLNEISQKGMPIVRPANFLSKYPGHGYQTVTTPFGKILIINLLGKEGINEKVSNPFKKVTEIIQNQNDHLISVLDFHAEMTSEKVAMGTYLDGKISAVLGTHTHVPTADAKILPGGTAHVSDVGMTGPKNSVLGVKSEIIVERFLKGSAGKFEIAEGPGVFNSVLVTFDEQGKPIKIKRIDK